MMTRVYPRTDMLLAAVMALLALALALKAMRYVEERPDTAEAAMQRIEVHLSADGWSRTATDVFPASMPLFAAHFAKPGCPVTTVTIIGRKSELMPYVAGTHDGDVFFVPPSTGSLTNLERLRALRLSSSVTKPLPLLAIAPGARPSGCALSIGG